MAFAAALPALIAAAATVGSSFIGKNAQKGSTYTKGQQSKIDEILQSLRGAPPNIEQNQNYQGGQEWLNNLFNDPGFFKSFEEPLQRQFREQTIPQLANQFGGMGSIGSLGSTAFRNQLGREGSNLSTNIAALRGGMQQQGVGQALQYGQQPINNWMQLLQMALQPTQNQYQPATNPLSGPLSAFWGGAAQGYGQQWGQSMAPGAAGGAPRQHEPFSYQGSQSLPGLQY